MSETIEKAREKQRVLFEGQTRFAEIKTEFFEDLMDIQRQPENLSCSDYCRIGFSHGYLEGYEKAKEETQPETKTGNPMPEILPGYGFQLFDPPCNRMIVVDICGAIVRFWLGTAMRACCCKDITKIWDRDGVEIWSKE